jgi:hypothetical protein
VPESTPTAGGSELYRHSPEAMKAAEQDVKIPGQAPAEDDAEEVRAKTTAKREDHLA